MKQGRIPKHYTEMDDRELAEATLEFEKEFVADSFKEPGEKAISLWQQASKKKSDRQTKREGNSVNLRKKAA